MGLYHQNGINKLRQHLGERLATVDSETRQSRVLVDDAREEVRTAMARLAVMEARFAETQDQQVALQALYQELAKGRDEVSLAEVEQTLELAAQQLALAGNVRGALIALQGLDTRLARADKGMLLPVRRAITRDIERLKAVPFVDVPGITTKLDQLMANADRLPLLSGQDAITLVADAPVAGGWWPRLKQDLGESLGELVRVRNTERVEVPVLSPTQSYFLRENLKLRLLNARLALLSRNEGAFRSDAQTAQIWLDTYFDTKSQGVAAGRATLKQLAESDITIAVPDLTESLTAVRGLRAAKEKGTP